MKSGLYSNTAANMMWIDVMIFFGTLLYFLPPTKGACPYGMEELDGSCYSLHNGPYSAIDGENFCQLEAGRNIAITGKIEVGNLFNQYGSGAWIVYDGSTLPSAGTYCTTIFAFRNIEAEPCTNGNAVICEAPTLTETTTSIASTAEESTTLPITTTPDATTTEATTAQVTTTTDATTTVESTTTHIATTPDVTTKEATTAQITTTIDATTTVESTTTPDVTTTEATTAQITTTTDATTTVESTTTPIATTPDVTTSEGTSTLMSTEGSSTTPNSTTASTVPEATASSQSTFRTTSAMASGTLATSSTPNLRNLRFSLVTRNGSIKNSNVLSTNKNARTRLHCASRCLSLVNCKVFTYNSTNQMCSLGGEGSADDLMNASDCATYVILNE